MKIGDISEVVKKTFPKEVKEAYSSPLIDWITQIQLAKKKKKVQITIELPLDILKNPNDVREFSGIPILTFIDLNK